MVAVIKCDRRITWTAPLFGRLFPYLIPVLGKPLLEYYVDYCILCNVSKIVFVVEKYNRQLFDFISRISACEIEIKVELSDSSNFGRRAMERRRIRFPPRTPPQNIVEIYRRGFF